MSSEEATAVRQRATALFGFVPNVVEEMNRNPAVANVYLCVSEALGKGTLPAREQQAAMLAVAAINGCDYCTAAHRTVGAAQGVSQEDLDRISRRQPPGDKRLRAVIAATWKLMEKHGFLSEDDLAELEQLGIERAELYELIAIIGMKTISNYINHIAHTEIDGAFRDQIFTVESSGL